MKKILSFIRKHKVLVGIVVLVLGGGGYWAYTATHKPTEETRYVLAAVQRGAIVSSVSGSGQVSALNQIDIKPKVSGDILTLSVKNGQQVKEGDVLATIDSQDAEKTLRDAQTNYQSAVLALQKLKQSPDKLSLLQAEDAVTSAQNALKKLQQPADDSSLLQAQNAVKSAQDNLTKLQTSQPDDYHDAQVALDKANDAATKAYEDAFNEISNTFLDLPTIITDVDGILHNFDINANEDNSTTLVNTMDVADRSAMLPVQQTAEDDYRAARAQYDKNFASFKTATRYSDRATVEALLADTIETTKQIAQTAKSESNYMDAWVDYRNQKHDTVFTQVKNNQAKASTDTSKVNGHLSSLLSIQASLHDDNLAVEDAETKLAQLKQNQPLDLAAAQQSVNEKEAALAKLQQGADSIDVSNAKASIAEKQAALDKLKSGPDSLDVRTQELTISQRANAVTDAQTALADYQIKAPFDGVIANVPVKKGDSASSGTAIATIITKQQIAEISLNEVDAAKVEVGDKVTLTFDAIDGLSVTGQVAELESVGTVSQGVVTYTAKITFDTQDDRVKPGMSTSAAIITQSKQDILVIDSTAIKASGDTSTVQVVTSDMIKDQNAQGVTLKGEPTTKTVTTGVANDTLTEITDGLAEGDQIIVRTIKPTTTAPTSQAPSLLGNTGGGNRAAGGGAGGNAAFRAGGGAGR